MAQQFIRLALIVLAVLEAPVAAQDSLGGTPLGGSASPQAAEPPAPVAAAPPTPETPIAAASPTPQTPAAPPVVQHLQAPAPAPASAVVPGAASATAAAPLSADGKLNPQGMVAPVVGGLAGAAAIAGVIAVSVMKQQKKMQPPPNVKGQYHYVGVGVAEPAMFNVDSAKGKGEASCYEAVMANSQCAKDYFTYVTRGDKNCGCNKPGTLAIRQDANSDYYAIGKARGIVTVEGTLTLQVPHAHQFVQDETAQKAVGAGLADVTKVETRYVAVSAKLGQKQRRLASAPATQPQLVHLDFEINIPPDDKVHTKPEIEALLGSTPAEKLTAAVQGRMRIAKGQDYQVAVISEKVSGQAPVVAEMCDAFQCPMNYMLKQNARFIEGKDWQTCCEVIPPSTTVRPSTQTTVAVTAPPPQSSTSEPRTPPPVFRANAEAFNDSSAVLGVNQTLLTNSSSSSLGGGSHSLDGSGHSNILLISIGSGVGGLAALVCCICCIARICLNKKRRGQKKPNKDWYARDQFDEEPLMNHNTVLEVMGNKPDMASQYLAVTPDCQSQYTGSEYRTASQYAGMRGPAAAPVAAPAMSVYAGMNSLPPPPPPAPGAGPTWQASPLANTVQSVGRR